MDIARLYKEFIEAAGKPFKKGDSQGSSNLKIYRLAKKNLFEALKTAYLDGKIKSEQADNLVRVITESAADPVLFWGSEKTAKVNQPIFTDEKNERLFEELLRVWKQCEERKKSNAD